MCIALEGNGSDREKFLCRLSTDGNGGADWAKYGYFVKSVFIPLRLDFTLPDWHEKLYTLLVPQALCPCNVGAVTSATNALTLDCQS